MRLLCGIVADCFGRPLSTNQIALELQIFTAIPPDAPAAGMVASATPDAPAARTMAVLQTPPVLLCGTLCGKYPSAKSQILLTGSVFLFFFIMRRLGETGAASDSRSRQY